MSGPPRFRLAIHGGEPVVRSLPAPLLPLADEALRDVRAVITSGLLSGFVAEDGPAFYGGEQVRALEAEWSRAFGSKYAIAMNSATSALIAALVAVGVEPGDDVVVTPFSMSASVTCAVAVGANPVYADIDPTTYCLDPESVRRAITSRTRAIVAVDLFGTPAVGVAEVAREAGVPLVEDAAQAPGAFVRGPERGEGWGFAGTLGDVGVFSLNRHKPLQCGEGGVAVTDDDEYGERLADARNHGEVRGGRVGYNFRMTEIEAAIARWYLARRDRYLGSRWRNGVRMTSNLREHETPGLSPMTVPPDRESVYYLYATRVREGELGCSRERFAAALRAEGVPVSEGYVRPLYHLRALRRPGTTFSPETERAYRELIVHPHVHSGMTYEDVDRVAEAFLKVYGQARSL